MAMPNHSQADAWSDSELNRKRALIRRGLARANTAALLSLMVAIGLCGAAIVEALRAERNSRLAADSSARAREELWRAHLARARAQRLSTVAGRKTESLAAIAAAAAIRSSVDLRDEAIAALALSDVTQAQPKLERLDEQAAALTPNLDAFAQPSSLGAIELRRVGTRELLGSFQGPETNVVNLAFSPSGALLAAAFRLGQVEIWRVATHESLLRWRCNRNDPHRTWFNFSPDEELLTLGCGMADVRVLKVRSGEELAPFKTAEPATQAAFRPDGKMLAVTVSNRIELRDCANREASQILTFPGEVQALAWHPDSRHLAASCAANSDILLWNTLTTNSRPLSGHAELVPNLLFNHRGDMLVSASWDGSTRFWEGHGGDFLFSSRTGFGAKFSANDARLAYVRERQGFGVWDCNPSSIYRELQLPIGSPNYITSFDFSPDRKSLIVSGPDGLHVFDLLTGTEQNFLPAQHTRSVSYTKDGTSVLVVATDHLSLWRLPVSGADQWSEERQFELPKSMSLDGGTVTPGAASILAVPGVEYAFFVDLRNPASFWSLPGEGQLGPLTCVALSPDTNWLATTYWRGFGTRVWDLRSRKPVQNLGLLGGFVSFSPNGNWLLVGSAHEFDLWDARTWQQVRRFDRNAPGELVGRGAFSPDSELLAICPDVDKAQLIETRTGQVLATLNAPALRNIGWLGFSPDGATLVASTFDNRLQVWNLRAMRSELAAVGLNWDLDRNQGRPEGLVLTPATSPAAAGVKAGWLGNRTFYFLDGLGVLTAVMVGLYTWHYQQRLVVSYEEIDRIVAQRNRQLELAQAELMHSQKMNALGTLAAGIAHDFNNLLSVIRMGNNLLRRPEISEADKTESGLAVERAVEQGKKVVRSMLGYSREHLDPSGTYSVPEVVNEAGLLLNQEFLRRITLTLELNRDAPRVVGSRGRLEQILLNLVVNAAEAMAGEGRLDIAVREVRDAPAEMILRPRPASQYVQLVVADTGPGIAPEIRTRVFEPFFSTKPRGTAGGTGLGLSQVYSLAEQEGMGISLQSEPGQGTAFSIWIPVPVARVRQMHVASEIEEEQN